MKMPMKLVSVLFVLSVCSGVARGADCPAGEAWDGAMAMCMPAAAAGQDTAENAVVYNLMTQRVGCGSDMYFHFGMSMCLPKPRAPGRLSAMLMANAFVVDSGSTGPRGQRSVAVPNWFMANVGVDLAAWNRLDLDVMLTAERWTYPAGGYPELLQIGEHDAAGAPYIDAQHPHSSPAMGLQLTEVISLSSSATRLVRIWFAPRGETTDGPIAFMHRATGTLNPDAPLGHHIGQDVGHVTSTVIGASLTWDSSLLEISTFHGREPEPTAVDLPIGRPNSFAVRLVQHWDPWLSIAMSAAYVTDPESDGTVPALQRFSASAYTRHVLPAGWWAHTTWIWGGIAHYDHAPFLNSIGVEAAFMNAANALWTRVEVLQRTPAELGIAAPLPLDDSASFVGAWTLGATRLIAHAGPVDLSVGALGTLSVLPENFSSAYGGRTALTARAYLEARYLQMFVPES